jgi:hypothetical protein
MGSARSRTAPAPAASGVLLHLDRLGEEARGVDLFEQELGRAAHARRDAHGDVVDQRAQPLDLAPHPLRDGGRDRGRLARHAIELTAIDAERLHRRAELVRHHGKERGSRLVGEAALVRVHAARDEAREGAVLVVEGHAAIEDPAVLAVAAPEPIVHLEGRGLLDMGAAALDDALQIVRMNALGPAVAELLLEAPAGEVEPRLIEKNAFSVGARPPDHRGRGLDEGAVLVERQPVVSHRDRS